MAATVSSRPIDRLERSCAAVGLREPAGRIRIGPGSPGLERFEARLRGRPYALHRHDAYAIAMTLRGAMTFFYRGVLRRCLPGQWHILHPDELHDGGSADDGGFAYRILYVDAGLIRAAIGGRPLPFVADPIVDARFVPPRFASTLRDFDEEIDDVARIDVAVAVADMLTTLSVAPTKAPPLRLDALMRVRDCIAAEPATLRPLTELERLSDLDRFTLARQFRAAFGTSLGRFRTMRRLDRVRRSLAQAIPLADAAFDAGFSDQSHMTRMFKRAYGITPGAWVGMVKNEASPSLG